MNPADSREDISKARHDTKLRRELGDVMVHLTDSRTEDVVVNPDGRLWVKRLGENWVSGGTLSTSRVLSAIGTVASMRGTEVNHGHPILETDLPLEGSPRFEALVPPVVSAPAFAILLRPRKIFSLEEYDASEILTNKKRASANPIARDSFRNHILGQTLDHAAFLREALRWKQNILIAGSAGSGKTTLLNAIIRELESIAPHDRVVAIEDTSELQCNMKNFIDLLAVGGITMLDCLRACMRLRPTRIVVGEVRGGEAHSLLKAWGTG